jgi:hypothetical protein
MQAEERLMKHEIWTGVRAGILVAGIVAFASPVMAQGQGGVKPDSTAENPSTKTGNSMPQKPMMKKDMKKGSNTGSMTRSKTATPQKMRDDKQHDINSSGAGGR